MIRESEIERYLDDWLGNAPMAPADRVVVAVAVRIGRQKQRPAPRLAWAMSDMAASTRLFAGLAAVLLIALVGLLVIRTGPPFGGTPPTNPPTQAATATPVASPSEPPPEIGVTIEGGVPSNWSVVGAGLLSFSTEKDGRSMSVELLPNRSVMAANCSMGPEVGVGTTAEPFVAAIAARAGLIATNEGPALVGGQRGRQVDVRADLTMPSVCESEGDDRIVPLLGVTTDDGFWNYVGVTGSEVIRVIVLDVPRDQNVVVFIVASDDQAFDQFIDDATTIVSRITFDFG